MNGVFIAESAMMREKIELAARFALSRTPVLVTGEAGAGKRAFVREVCRRVFGDAPLTVIPCAARPGKFTPPAPPAPQTAAQGAAAQEAATPEAAVLEPGAVLLEEPAEMEEAAQEALAAWLSALPVKTLIFSTTRKNIEEETKRGAFRRDLAAKLALLPLYIPPLRQRPEDITPLAVFFLEQMSRACAMRLDGFSEDALATFREYRWPGNVRELKNRVEAACLAKTAAADCAGRLIGTADLTPGAFNAAGSLDIDARMPLKTAVDMFKSAFIKKTLAGFDGNRAKTAASLGIQRTYLFALMKELGIQ